MMTNLMREFENVYWLGGSPCAGKSSISELLAARFDLDIYRVDDAFQTHSQAFDPVLHSTLTRWCASSWNERWMQPVETLVNDVIACYQEHLGLVLDDLRSLQTTRQLLVEGSALLPRRVTEIALDQGRTIWIVPTADFQYEHYSNREWVRGILEQCDEPNAAFQNWMARDAGYARWITREAETLCLKILHVDGRRTVEQNAMVVAEHFGLSVT